MNFASCFKCFATGLAFGMLLTLNAMYGGLEDKQSQIDELTEEIDTYKMLVHDGVLDAPITEEKDF
jgi:hypothetical protein